MQLASVVRASEGGRETGWRAPSSWPRRDVTEIKRRLDQHTNTTPSLATTPTPPNTASCEPGELETTIRDFALLVSQHSKIDPDVVLPPRSQFVKQLVLLSPTHWTPALSMTCSTGPSPARRNKTDS
ncbi:hypothetical protein E2C01_018110 [Portunus trituberculatus]|uniref:Uncharacterized protein n=1 Tax=Portunus trituberculatus TaxID=210409 RepID=A0A5B7DTM9_PORTR|nr:hypothetical protein [Portunus trituberculatus]